MALSGSLSQGIPERLHMHPARINTPVIVLAVWCAVALLTLGTLKTVQADDIFQSGEVVREVCMSYTEQYYSECISLSEKDRSAACNMPVAHAEGRLWPTQRPRVDLQVPEVLVRALLMQETAGSIIDLQVPEALLFMLYAEEL
jgi:hypothetical protein